MRSLSLIYVFVHAGKVQRSLSPVWLLAWISAAFFEEYVPKQLNCFTYVHVKRSPWTTFLCLASSRAEVKVSEHPDTSRNGQNRFRSRWCNFAWVLASPGRVKVALQPISLASGHGNLLPVWMFAWSAAIGALENLLSQLNSAAKGQENLGPWWEAWSWAGASSETVSSGSGGAWELGGFVDKLALPVLVHRLFLDRPVNRLSPRTTPFRLGWITIH